MNGAQLSGAGLIVEERRRQIEVEGYAADHDDLHVDGELLQVAHGILEYFENDDEPYDPWGLIGRHSRRPYGGLRLLVIAGALIAAEIDRRQRADAPKLAKGH